MCCSSPLQKYRIYVFKRLCIGDLRRTDLIQLKSSGVASTKEGLLKLFCRIADLLAPAEETVYTSAEELDDSIDEILVSTLIHGISETGFLIACQAVPGNDSMSEFKLS